MPTSAEETTDFIITREDRQAAKTLVALSQGKRYHPREEGEEKCKEVDNSEETMMIIKAWNLAKPDPVENIPSNVADLVERFSEPIKKQLRVSDVKDNLRRLLLGKDQVNKKMRPLLIGSEIKRLREGLDVTVYGPGNVVQNMTFKKWTKGQPVLTSGWKGFVDACELKEHCDFLHIWMFRHRVTRKLCFVIEKTNYSTITKPLAKEISDQIN
ncbi:putative B3 domain-containing protein [Raphanus sativus]|uniref:B3 domain-containing protein At4g03170 n=1 Tax=Raphanus sativus TaxID=3726 RepID=A0A6J0JL61_RAPSA|nr:putative B3 domain-containing protein At4g03170 [Raphanus sativus]KAJ4892023.1 putative B3 domain-containing protein [Raphanus sativus]